MIIEKKKKSDLKPAPYNPRKSNEKQEANLKKSLEKFGVVEPIVFNKRTGYIVGGHFRIRELKKLGYKEVDCVIVDLNEDDEKELNIRLNANTGEWNWEILQADWDVEQLNDWGLELEELFEELEAEDDDFDVPEGGIETDIVLGDLIEIGEHRLLCGDSTDSDAVAKLMNGGKADMVFTSPPYNANMNMISSKNGKVKSTPFYENNETDNKTSKEFVEFLSSVLNNCILNTDGWIFWNIGYNANSRSEWVENTYHFKDYLQETIIWKKTSAMPVKHGFTRIIEFIFLYTTKGNKVHINKEAETISNFWEVSNNNSSIENHKACFPIELVSKALNINRENKLILEPFCGSGTTMVAAHQLNRKCYGMELDPKYCQVIVDRMIALDDSLIIKINGKEYKQ